MHQVARIFKPSKTAMQSGRARTKKWRLEFEPGSRRFVEPLMGWTGSSDTASQVAIHFETEDEAVAFCKKHGIDYVILPPRERRPKIRGYSDNFAYNRVR